MLASDRMLWRHQSADCGLSQYSHCCTGVKQGQEVSLQAGGAGGEGASGGAPAWQELGQGAGVRRSSVVIYVS